MDSEEKIMQALKQIQADDAAEPRAEGLGQMLGDMFREQAAWLSVVSTLAMLALLALAVYSAVRFFGADDLKTQLLCCTGFLFSMMTISFVKVWFWLHWLRNSTLREIKRFELRLLVAQEKGK